ncbi:sugar transferase [Candidatus Thiodiazotropha sp. LNASS1]|uniref:sugar transferase n=1 Tax=Candidatus Thiodiazotropha sp. LNASS1 TaxID=3096260 RepID=UPI003488F26A
MSGKRAFDLIFAAMGLVLFSLLLLIILVLILLEYGTPVVFAQERIGRHFRPFTLYKLRSMRNGKVTRPLTREDARRLNLYDEDLPRC